MGHEGGTRWWVVRSSGKSEAVVEAVAGEVHVARPRVHFPLRKPGMRRHTVASAPMLPGYALALGPEDRVRELAQNSHAGMWLVGQLTDDEVFLIADHELESEREAEDDVAARSRRSRSGPRLRSGQRATVRDGILAAREVVVVSQRGHEVDVESADGSALLFGISRVTVPVGSLRAAE